MKRILLLLTFTFVVLHCRPNPEDLFAEAREKLQEEDPGKARELMELAYDLSLPETMLPLGYKEKFHAGTISASKQVLTLVNTAEEALTVFYYSLAEKKPALLNKFELKLINFHDVVSSPSGTYTLIKSSDKDNQCQLTVISVEAKNSQKIPATSIACKNKPAVKDNGQVYFTNESKIQTYDYSTSRVKELQFENLTINLKLINHFYLNAANDLFFTQGMGGIYTLYALGPRKTTKLKSDLSSGSIIFNGNNKPISVLGGAGNYVLIQLDQGKPGSFQKIIEKVRFDKLQFLSKKDYIFSEYGLLSLTTKGTTKELSFWVKDFFVGPKQEIYLLSKSGILLHYEDFVMSELSRKIFREGAVLYEGG